MQWLVSRTEPGDCQNNGAAIGTQEQAHENPPHRNLGLRTGSNCSPQSPHRMVVNRSSFPHFWHLFLAGSLDFAKIARARHGGANRHWTRSGSWAVAPVPSRLRYGRAHQPTIAAGSGVETRNGKQKSLSP